MYKQIPFKRAYLSAGLINLLAILFVFVFSQNIPPEVPLLYGLPRGEEQLVPKFFLILPTAAALIIVILAALTSIKIKDLFVKQIFLGTSIVITTLAIMTVVKIINLVGSWKL